MGACPVCGNTHDESATFCATCGAPLRSGSAPTVPPPPPGMAPVAGPTASGARPPSNGLLRSAGIIEIVEGSLVALTGLGLYALGTRYDGDRSAFFLGALVAFAIATACILVGSFTVQGRRGAAITLIVLQALGVLSGLGTLATGGGVVILLLAGVTLALAAFGLQRQQLPH